MAMRACEKFRGSWQAGDSTDSPQGCSQRLASQVHQGVQGCLEAETCSRGRREDVWEGAGKCAVDSTYLDPRPPCRRRRGSEEWSDIERRVDKHSRVDMSGECGGLGACSCRGSSGGLPHSEEGWEVVGGDVDGITRSRVGAMLKAGTVVRSMLFFLLPREYSSPRF